MNIFLKHCNGKNCHFMRFWHQNVASRVYALLSVIRQQMSAFFPFRGGGRPKQTMSAFLTVFFVGELPLVLLFSIVSNAISVSSVKCQATQTIPIQNL